MSPVVPANGTLTPPAMPPSAASPTPSAKRKRSESQTAAPAHGASSAGPNSLHGSSRPLQATIEDIFKVLKSYDTKPSVLDWPLESTQTRSPSTESDTKRAKLTPPTGPTSIASCVRDASYSSLDAFEKDVKSATSAALALLEGDDPPITPLSAEQANLQKNILALRAVARTLIAREESRWARVAAKKGPKDAVVNGDATPIKSAENDESTEGRTVLTLYGTAQGPKQLFSSLQQPVDVLPENAGATSALDASVKVTMPLRESSLPNIISTTQVFPLPEDDDRKSKPKTFGELFPRPSHIPQLQAPKLSKPQTTKGNTVTWTSQDAQDALELSSRDKSSHVYSVHKQAAGNWLGYGGVDMPQDVISPTAKAKSRQRALSTGEAQSKPSEATLVAVQEAKADALFRAVYSSFAPSRDDSMAVVPAEVKSMVWWRKVGEKRFKDTFPEEPSQTEPAQPAPIDPALLALQEDTDPIPVEDELEVYKEMVENWDESVAEPNPLEAVPKSQAEKDTDEILQEISEELEMLASYQRIRNSSLATNPLAPNLQNSSLASLAGSPSTPSAEEIDVYQMLKAHLTMMISMLPPYAVAKLNGDQLNDLNISRTLIIETEDRKGVLEDDQYSRRAAVPAPAPTPSLTRMASGGSAHSHFSPSTSQYGRSTPVAHQPSARPVQQPTSYFPQSSVQRTPSVNYGQRPAAPVGAYQTPAAPAYAGAAPRQSYNASQYGQQSSRTPFAQPATNQYYPQRTAAPASNYGNTTNPQYFQSTPQAQAQTQAHRYSTQQPQNGYYQRPQTNGSYNYNATSSARTVSPMKPNPSAAPNMRGGYATPAQAPHMRSSYYNQGTPAAAVPPQQYASPQPPSTPAPVGAVGSYNAMSGGNHQQMLLERQQSQQVAAQNQARLQAQNSFSSRNGSGTPQPPPPSNIANGTNGANGAGGQYGQGQGQSQGQATSGTNGAPMVA